MRSKKKKIIIALSGGVDSSVSAALVHKAGFDVVGVFMKCWSEEEVQTGVCTAEEDEQWARRAAAKIGIPFYSVDLVKEYRQRVVDYLIEGYKEGYTPNPDVMCNKEIKFGMFYDMAIGEFGADMVATGHYAQIKKDPFTKLLKGKDPGKDQSYFLWAIKQEKLENVLFPIGGYLKSDVRKLAHKYNLPNAERKDSQGICFIGKVDIQGFLKEYIKDSPGSIVNAQGKEVGQHAGLHYFTIGQRRGIQVGGGPPYFVAGKDYKTNSLLVVREYDEELYQKNLICSNFNWIRQDLQFPLTCSIKIRYRQEDQDAILYKKDDQRDKIFVEFKTSQRAVTKGQSTVFYQGNELIGGGVIN